MLVIKVELWPEGRSDQAHELGRAAAANVAHIGGTGDYLAVVTTGEDGAVAFHLPNLPAEAGFWHLVARVAASQADAVKVADIHPYWKEVAALIADRMYEDGEGPTTR